VREWPHLAARQHPVRSAGRWAARAGGGLAWQPRRIPAGQQRARTTPVTRAHDLHLPWVNRRTSWQTSLRGTAGPVWSHRSGVAVWSWSETALPQTSSPPARSRIRTQRVGADKRPAPVKRWTGSWCDDRRVRQCHRRGRRDLV